MIETVDVAIVGGGLAGLTTAYRIVSDAPKLRTVVLEESDRVGGAIRTERIPLADGECIVEWSADSFLGGKPAARELIGELGLTEELVPINRIETPVDILKHGRRHSLPPGTMLVTPTSVQTIARTGLLSPTDKLRAIRDLVLPARTDMTDEAVGTLVRRRLGSGMVDWIAEPLAAGIYNADPYRLSLQATMPQIAMAERNNRGLIRGLRVPVRTTSAPPAFLTLRNGMQRLTEGLAERMSDRIRVRSRVLDITATRNGYLLATDSGAVEASKVVLATPAQVSRVLLVTVAPQTSDRLSELRTNPSVTVTLAVQASQLRRPLAGYGLLLPAAEHRPINAITVSSAKFPDRAPEGWSLVRIFAGGYRSPRSVDLNDDQLLAICLEQLRDLVGLSGTPAFSMVVRRGSASPQYDLNHLDRVAEIEQSLPPGISLVGCSYRGVGIPDVVRNATECAKSIVSTHVSSIQTINEGNN